MTRITAEGFSNLSPRRRVPVKVVSDESQAGIATLVIFRPRTIQLRTATTSTNYSRTDLMLDGRLSVPPKLLVILSIAVLILLASTQTVYAVGGTVDGSTCASTFGGTWDGADSCTITSGITVSSGETLTIPNGVNLVLSNSQGTGITLNSGGTLSNSGTITVANTDGSYGIQNNYGGTLSSSGTIRVSNNGGIGIVNFGSLSNSGTMTVSNSGSTGIANSGGGMLTNNPGGTIVVSNTGSDTDGIGNSGSLSNLGTIKIGRAHV